MIYLRRHGVSSNEISDPNTPKITLKFMPNATRWNSWYEMVFYVCDYLEYLRGFFQEKEFHTNENIDEIIAFFNDFNERNLSYFYSNLCPSFYFSY